MSAHWMTKGSFITSDLHPRIIYDFYGFPEKLYHVQYPAVGSPAMAQHIAAHTPQIVPSATWGIDHGAWSVLFFGWHDPFLAFIEYRSLSKASSLAVPTDDHYRPPHQHTQPSL